MLKERLCFDPEFWNLLNLRTHCLELMSDKVMEAAVLSDMKEDEEKEQSEEVVAKQCLKASCVNSFNSCQCPAAAAAAKDDLAEEPSVARDTEESSPLVNDAPRKRRKWKRRLGRRKKSDDELGDDPEITFNLGSTAAGNKPSYSLRYKQSNKENTSASVKLPLNHKREYLSRRVKSQILKRKGRKRRWLQGLLTLEQDTGRSEKIGKKRGRKPLAKLEYSYPDNELVLMEEEEKEEKEDKEEKEEQESGLEAATDSVDIKPDVFDQETNHVDQAERVERGDALEELADCVADQQEPADAQTQPSSEGPVGEVGPAAAAAATDAAAPTAEAGLELDGPPLEPLSCLLERFHNYCMRAKKPDDEDGEHEGQPVDLNELNGEGEEEPAPTEDVDSPSLEVSARLHLKSFCLFLFIFVQVGQHLLFLCLYKLRKCSILGKMGIFYWS